jgi:hypothetical protein
MDICWYINCVWTWLLEGVLGSVCVMTTQHVGQH